VSGETCTLARLPEWLAWQSTEGGGRIVGGSVAIGSNAAGDRSTVAGDRPAVDAGPVGVNTDLLGTVAAHPEDVLAVALGLVLHGDHARIVRSSSASVHAPAADGTVAAGVGRLEL